MKNFSMGCQNDQKDNSNILAAGFFCFIGSLIWMRLFTSGLPLTFGDDMEQIRTAVEVSWSSLIRHWLFPLSPAWFIPSTDAYLTTRIFETVLIKIDYFFGGYNAELYHWTKDLAFAGVCAGIYFFAVAISRRVTSGLVSALLFITAPFVYQSACWISDFELIAQFCFVVSAFLFVRGHERRFSWMGWLAVIVIAWLGFKTRESSKMFPLIVLSFLIWNQIRPLNQAKTKKWGAWTAAVISLLLIIPSHPKMPTVSLAGGDGVLSVWGAIGSNPHVHRLLSNPVLFIVIVVLAVLLAVFLFKIFWNIFFRYSRCFAPDSSRDNSAAYLRFVSIWFCVMLLATVSCRTYFKWRYLTILWIPFTILASSVFGNWNNSTHSVLRRLSKWGCLLAVIFVGGCGIYYSIYLRNHMSIKDISAFNIAQLVYHDRFEGPEPGQFELMNYYLGRPPAMPGEFDGVRVNEWDVIYNRDIPRERHQQVIQERLNDKFDQWGVAYLATVQQRGFEIKSGATHLGSVSSSNQSLFSRLAQFLGYHYPIYHIYVWRQKPNF